MAQINQYPNEAIGLNDNDLFDIDKNLGEVPIGSPQWESQKLKFGTLVSEVSSVIGGGSNLGNSNLVQTDPNRSYISTQGKLNFLKMLKFGIQSDESNGEPNREHGFNYNRSMGGNPTDKNKLMFEIFINGLIGAITEKSLLKIYEEGRLEIPTGGLGVGDGSLLLNNFTSDSSNSGLLALFASSLHPVLFTDTVFSGFPTIFEPQNSAIVWFKSESKGVLFPSMTTAERDSIITPEFGLQIFNSELSKMQVYSGIGGTGWQSMN